MINSTRCAFMAKQACATFSQVVRKTTPPIANNFLKFFFALFATLTLNAATAWAETKTEGFEEATTSTNYQGTVTVNTEQSDCGIGWTIYYGCVSTSSKISGNNSAALRLYTSNNYGYLKTTTPIDGLSKVTFNAKAATSNSAKIKVNISYSKDGSTWINIKSDETYNTTSQSKSYDIPSGGKYFQIAISSNSTKPTKSNAQLTIDDVVFTYTATSTPVDPIASLNGASYTVGQTLDLSTLWTSNSDGAVTYSIVEAGTTGASINGTSFTATAAGTCIVKASQTATSAYNAITKTATITVTAPAPAIITLFEAGATSSVSGKYVGDSYTLPSTSSQACVDKTFVGWSTEIIENSATKPTAATYFEPGASVTLGATNKFYAVFAEGDGSEILTSITGGDWSTGADGDWSTYGTGTYSGNGVKFDDANDYVTSPDMSSKGYTRLLLKFKSGHNGGQGSVLTFCAYNKNATLLTEDDVTIDPKTVVPTDAYTAQNTIYQVNISANEVIGKIMIIMTSKTKNLGMKYCEIFGVSSSYQNYTTKCVQTYKVTFNANGHGTAPTAQNVEENKKATEPTEPSATGYTFDGWYTDQACSDDKKFDFDTPITEDITLYAKWTINQYTVTLNPNYPDGQTGTFTDKDGNSVNKIELKYDYNTASMNLTNLYEEIKLEGYQFNGWYNATAGGSRWTSTGTITKDINLYAQWTKLHTIILYENGTTTDPTIQASTSYTLPTELSAGSCQDDTKEFVGWSTVAIPTPGDKPTSKYHELGETVTLSTDETTFYAVFATLGGATVTKTITLSPPTTTSGYKTGTKTDSEGNTWSYYAAINNQSGTYEFGLNADDKNYHIASPEFAGVVTSVSFKARNGSSSESRKFLFCSSNSTAKPSTGDLAEVIIPKSEQYNNTYTADLSASSVSQFYIYTPKALGITNISVTYTTSDGVSYSDYVTSCSSTPDPVNSDWVLTPLADITCNDLVVITMKNSNGTYALTNGNGTSDAPKATEVEIANDKLKTEPSEILQWVVMNNNGELTIHPVNDYNSWLYCFNDNDGVRVADKENKVFIVDKNSGYLYNQSTARYLGVYNNSEWRCYTTVNNNIKEQTLAFYVKKDANPNPCEEPVGDIESVATFIFNTAEGLEKLGITNVESSCNISEGHKFIQEGITMTNVKNGSTSTRVWSLNSGSYDLRMYKKAVFKLSAPQGHNIRKIVFDGENIQSITADNGVLSQKIWTGKQQEVVFTIADDAETVKIYTISVAVDYTRDVTLDEYGTICIPYGSNNYTGAKFYEVSWLKEGLGLYLDELAANAELVAGKPYIFRATSDEIEIICTGEAVINPVDGVNGLTGTFTKIEDLQTSDPSNTLEGNYMIADNKIWLCGTSCWLNANRAYIKDSKLPKTEQAKIPGRRRVCMGENTTTDFENITNGENNTIKVIENGQLFIIRNGEKYNIQGQRL